MAQRNFFMRAGRVLATAIVLAAIIGVAWWDRAVSVPPREAERLLAQVDFSAWGGAEKRESSITASTENTEPKLLPTTLPRGDLAEVARRGHSESLVSSHLPGGGLPMLPADDATVSIAEKSPRRNKSASREIDEPGRIHVENAKPIAAAQQPAKLMFVPPAGSNQNDHLREEAKQENSINQNSGGSMLAVEVQPVPKFLQTVSHEEPVAAEEHPLFAAARKLHVAETAVSARQQLIDQGLPTHIVAFAQAATDADWRLRLQVVEAVPRLAGIDAPVWLLHLSRDEATEVRQAAVAIMATSGDERYRQRLDEIAAADADDRVRAQARKATAALR